MPDTINTINSQGTDYPLEDATARQAIVSLNAICVGLSNDIPTKVSELTNDAGYITIASVPTKNSELENTAKYATVSQVPTKTSQLVNDSGYITSATLSLDDYYTKEEVDYQIENIDPTKIKIDLSNYYNKEEVNTLIENVDPDLSNYYTKSEVDTKIADIDLSAYYTKTETNATFAAKTDIEDFITMDDLDLDTEATQAEVDYVLGKEE